MSLKHGLLGLLSYEGPTTGYDLDKLFKESLNYFWHAKTSQIYRELGAMEQLGWLTSERVIQEEKPNKRVYSITEQGKTELVEWLSSPVTSPESRAKSSFLMRIFFAGEIGKDPTLRMLRGYKKQLAAYINEMGGIQNEISKDEAAGADKSHTKYWRLTALHGEMHCKTAIEWADKAIAILEEEGK